MSWECLFVAVMDSGHGGQDRAHRTSPDVEQSNSSDSCDRSMTLSRQLKCPKLAVETWQEQWRNCGA